MAFRLLCCLSVISFVSPIQSLNAQEPADKNPASPVRSYVQGRGTGSVTLKPAFLRISIPIKVVEDTSWDATEKLRQVRQEVVDRATEMSAIEGSIRTVGFQCMDATNPTSSFVAPGLNREAPDSKVMAKCYLVADFKVRELEDHEAMIAMSQSQLEELMTLIPKEENKRRSYSYSTLSSGLTTQQLDRPLALFCARVSEEDRVKAFKMAVENANRDLKIALGALGVESNVPISIHQSATYTSTRHNHPVHSAIYRNDESLAISMYPDAVNYAVSLNVSANFNTAE